ncbi:MAG: helix-turn-helix transcriptional regulator [Saprospiraceae bacterium]|nr:helix-turn-helix transcriptional regulator [Saprospiraceae bacterium]
MTKKFRMPKNIDKEQISNISEYKFAKNLRFLRKVRKLTLLNLASATDISKSALSDYETGKSKPGLDTLLKLSIYFDVPLDELNNSDISEFLNDEKKSAKHKNSEITNSTLSPEVENERYAFHLKLLHQKLESTRLQMQLLRQLLESKEAENRTLKINLKLLEEQLSRIKKT